MAKTRFTDAGERLGNARKWVDRNAEDVVSLNSAELKKYGKKASLWKFDAAEYQDKFDIFYIMLGKMLHSTINGKQSMPSAFSLPEQNSANFADLASLKVKIDEQAYRLYMYSILRLKQLYEAGPEVFFNGGEVKMPTYNEKGEKVGEKTEYLSRAVVLRDIADFYQKEVRDLYKATSDEHPSAYGIKYRGLFVNNSYSFYYQTGLKNVSANYDDAEKHRIASNQLRENLVHRMAAFSPISAGKKPEHSPLYALFSPIQFFTKQLNNFAYKIGSNAAGQKFVDYKDFYTGDFTRLIQELGRNVQRNAFIITDENPTFSQHFLHILHKHLDKPSAGQALLLEKMREDLKIAPKEVKATKIENKSVDFVSAKDEYKARYITNPTKELKTKTEYLGNVTRKGVNWRTDNRVIQPEDIVETFGFRGFEYGNWLTNKDRQNVTNAVYDACFDLAFVLGIDPKELGLKSPISDKCLGLGIGTAGVRDSKASFQYPANVINMNKKNSAGSFAHEFMHALDYHQNAHLGVSGESERQNPAMKKLVSLLKYKKHETAPDILSLSQEEKNHLYLTRLNDNLNSKKQTYSRLMQSFMAFKKSPIENLKQLSFESMITVLDVHKKVLKENITVAIDDLYHWAKKSNKKIDMTVISFRPSYLMAYLGAQTLDYKNEIYQGMIYSPSSSQTSSLISDATSNYFDTGMGAKMRKDMAEILIEQHPDVIDNMRQAGMLKTAEYFRASFENKLSEEDFQKQYKEKVIDDINLEMTTVMASLNNEIGSILINECVKEIFEKNQDVFYMNAFYLSKDYTTHTDFYENALLMAPYYSEDAELLARAFETWVGVELEKNGMHNYYLHKHVSAEGATIEYFDFYELEAKQCQNPLYPNKELANVFGQEIKRLVRSQFLKKDIDLSELELTDKHEVWKVIQAVPSIDEELEKKFRRDATSTATMQQMALF